MPDNWNHERMVARGHALRAELDAKWAKQQAFWCLRNRILIMIAAISLPFMVGFTPMLWRVL